jgi:hypothetical protein
MGQFAERGVTQRGSYIGVGVAPKNEDLCVKHCSKLKRQNWSTPVFWNNLCVILCSLLTFMFVADTKIFLDSLWHYKVVPVLN